MSILADYNNTISSKVYRLCQGSKVLGLRVKIYNSINKKFDYYDFSINLIKDKSIQNFLLRNKNSFEKLELILVDNLLVTQQELNSKLIINEFKDESSALNVLSTIIKINSIKKEV